MAFAGKPFSELLSPLEPVPLVASSSDVVAVDWNLGCSPALQMEVHMADCHSLSCVVFSCMLQVRIKNIYFRFKKPNYKTILI